jgi:hypothetical protein
MPDRARICPGTAGSRATRVLFQKARDLPSAQIGLSGPR